MPLSLSSTVFQSGQTIPAQYTCEGENISPPLSWIGMPRETETLVLIFDDPDAPNGTFCHWVLYNIPKDMTELPGNISQNLPDRVMQGRNSYGNARYDGPCPPMGSEHTYYFRLFAVDKRFDLLSGATREQILDLIQNHGIESTELLVRFSRATAQQQS